MQVGETRNTTNQKDFWQVELLRLNSDSSLRLFYDAQTGQNWKSRLQKNSFLLREVIGKTALEVVPIYTP